MSYGIVQVPKPVYLDIGAGRGDFFKALEKEGIKNDMINDVRVNLNNKNAVLAELEGGTLNRYTKDFSIAQHAFELSKNDAGVYKIYGDLMAFHYGLPFKDNSIDAVFFNNPTVLEEVLGRELKGVIKPGGNLIIQLDESAIDVEFVSDIIAGFYSKDGFTFYSKDGFTFIPLQYYSYGGEGYTFRSVGNAPRNTNRGIHLITQSSNNST